MHQAAQDYVALFDAEITRTEKDWVEVKAGPFLFYFVQDGTRDIAFSVTVDDVAETLAKVQEYGFVLDKETTDRVKETFVLSRDGIRINLDPGA